MESSRIQLRERERNVLFNDTLNTFYLQLCGVRHMVKDHSDSEKGNPLIPYNRKIKCVSLNKTFPSFHGGFQPVLHNWCNKGCGMCYPVCGMVHIKEPLLLIGKSSPCGCIRLHLSLSEWSFTICLILYN